MKLNTVNVIEIIDGSITEVFSYADNKKGNKEAEAKFTKLAKEMGIENKGIAEQTELEEALENGFWNTSTISVKAINRMNYDYSIFITHSS
jgi:hypothetical protein